MPVPGASPCQKGIPGGKSPVARGILGISVILLKAPLPVSSGITLVIVGLGSGVGPGRINPSPGARGVGSSGLPPNNPGNPRVLKASTSCASTLFKALTASAVTSFVILPIAAPNPSVGTDRNIPRDT